MAAIDTATGRPRVTQTRARVVTNERVTADGKVLSLDLPDDFPQSIPGQFVHVQIGAGLSPFLRRPFSILSDRREAGRRRLQIMYAVVGVATEQMRTLEPGATIDVMGPLGNAFALEGHNTWILMAGGRGAVPLFRILEGLEAGEYDDTMATPPAIRFLFGARTQAHLWWLDRLTTVEHMIATDDGSQGVRGTVVDLLRATMETGPERAVVVACGPEPMLEAVSHAALELGVPAQVSLESRMGCACGLCRGCVVPRRLTQDSPWPRDGNATYGTVCKEGPIFLGHEIEWERVPEI